MALLEKRVCDVFGTIKGVERYCVKVFVVGDKLELIALSNNELDLSPRGLARLEKFIRRGMRAPSKDDKLGDDAASTHGQTSLMPNLQGLGEPAESEES